MTIQKLSLVGFCFMGLLLLAIRSPRVQGADQPPNLSTLSDEDLKTLTIQLKRTACLGTCPAYSVAIHGDGRVEYSGQSNVKETGTREGRIGLDAIRALASEFAKAKFWGFPEDYPEKKCKRVCTDMPGAVTELKIRGLTHRVDHYYGCIGVPKSLFDLESAIDKSANSEQWTGDVSKAGPMATTCM